VVVLFDPPPPHTQLPPYSWNSWFSWIPCLLPVAVCFALGPLRRGLSAPPVMFRPCELLLLGPPPPLPPAMLPACVVLASSLTTSQLCVRSACAGAGPLLVHALWGVSALSAAVAGAHCLLRFVLTVSCACWWALLLCPCVCAWVPAGTSVSHAPCSQLLPSEWRPHADCSLHLAPLCRGSAFLPQAAGLAWLCALTRAAARRFVVNCVCVDVVVVVAQNCGAPVILDAAFARRRHLDDA
jgi:hypothetical protein